MAGSRRDFLKVANGALLGLSMGPQARAEVMTTQVGRETPPVARSFARILSWADANLPLLRESLRPGASADDLRGLETLIGQPLPEDVRELYRLADGQMPFDARRTPALYPGLFLGLPFNPIEIVMRHWSVADGAIDRNDARGFPNTAEYLSSFPVGAVKVLHFNRGWIPLSDDDGGNFMAVDLDPGPTGNPGQWIVFGRDEDERLRVASSLAAFLHWVAGEMEAGHFGLTQWEEHRLSPRDVEALRAGRAVAVPQPPPEDYWSWHANDIHLPYALRNYLKAGGQIG